MADKSSIKIEIPLPQWSPRLRFSLRTLLLAIAICALGFAIYRHARTTERSLHSGGQFHLVLSSPHMMEAKPVECRDFRSLQALASSSEIRVHSSRDEATTNDMWPPRVWIKRANWDSIDLEETIVVDCRGTPAEPVVSPDIALKPGDRVFFDYGRRAMPQSLLTTDAAMPAKSD